MQNSPLRQMLTAGVDPTYDIIELSRGLESVSIMEMAICCRGCILKAGRISNGWQCKC